MTDIVKWLLDSDPSLSYQVKRDLLHVPEDDLRNEKIQISESGWVSELLKNRHSNGHWGNGVYNPKWTCTHYVLYELMQLGIPTKNAACHESCYLLLNNPYGKDGGINYAKTVEYSDVCINGMILSIVSYFSIHDDRVHEIVDYLLRLQMHDGGWNCEYMHDAVHSSLHTTISVLEGFEIYCANKYEYRKTEIQDSIEKGIEFILKHQLYKSDTTGEIIKDEFFKFCFPIRWKYDVVRCMDLFRKYGIQYDERMNGALEIIERSKNKHGRWKAQSQGGKTYFVMEKNGEESKWNTLRALRVLQYYKRSPAIA